MQYSSRPVAHGGDGQLEMQLIRETLEGMLSADVTTLVILEALDKHGAELPRGLESLNDFVRGPLQQALRKRATEDEVESVIERIDLVLRSMLRNAAPAPSTRRSPSQNPTARIDLNEVPPPLLIVAEGQVLETRLRAAIGRHLLTCMTAKRPDRLATLVKQFKPALVIVDSTDAPNVPAELFAQILAAVPTSTTCVIWGRDEPYAEQLGRNLQNDAVRVVALDRREGFAPLVDLVRSRL